MGRLPVKHISHSFSLVWRKGCHINQQFYFLILCGPDDGTSVRMSNQDNVAFNSAQCSIKRAKYR